MKPTIGKYDHERGCHVVADVLIPRGLFLKLAALLQDDAEAAGHYDNPFNPRTPLDDLKSIMIYGVWFYPDPNE